MYNVIVIFKVSLSQLTFVISAINTSSYHKLQQLNSHSLKKKKIQFSLLSVSTTQYYSHTRYYQNVSNGTEKKLLSKTQLSSVSFASLIPLMYVNLLAYICSFVIYPLL